MAFADRLAMNMAPLRVGLNYNWKDKSTHQADIKFADTRTAVRGQSPFCEAKIDRIDNLNNTGLSGQWHRVRSQKSGFASKAWVN